VGVADREGYGLFAVVQQDGLDSGMMLEEADEFRAAVASMSDDASLGVHLVDYSLL